ncbi:MAG: hypothetical protein A2054_04985 [Deltaproteobacteria bacterium GWA2_55_10]|nr:MAG: hypothetical protein A2054_04985 [Deltaproteobacteria bacterium GWA2_55_10]
MKRSLPILLCSMALFWASDSSAQSYVEEVIHYPGSLYTTTTGVNDLGQVVGYYGGDDYGGFIYDGQEYTDFVPGFTATGINNNGQAIGWTSDWGGAFYDGKELLDIDYPGAQFSQALDINNEGQVLGSYSMDGVEYKNYIYDSGEFTALDLAFPGAYSTLASGFNDNGDLVGSYDPDPNSLYNSMGFIFKDNGFTDVDHPYSGEFDSTFLVDINNSGQVVGGYINELLESANFLYEDGAFTELPSMYTDMSYVYGINDLGQIVGSFYGPYNGEYEDLDHGFLLTPFTTASNIIRTNASVPEPSALLLLAGSFAGVIALRKRIR